VNQAWPFLTGENFKAETRINAQPGATLTDMESYGNVHGVSFQYFRTEDTGYYYTPQHNYTTPWNFQRDQPPPTHFVIHIGANDASWSVPEKNFTKVGPLSDLRVPVNLPHCAVVPLVRREDPENVLSSANLRVHSLGMAAT
jgi:hypothetical protein